MRAVYQSEKGDVVFFQCTAHYSKMDRQGSYSLLIAAVITAIYQDKIIEQNGTFENTSSAPVLAIKADLVQHCTVLCVLGSD